MNSRTLCIATLVGCFGFSFSGAGAAELADVDLSNIPLNKPTLDYLHENNVQIPQTEYDDEGNLVESGSILAPESAYALTEVPAGAGGAAPVGDNIITKFNYNSETGEFTPVYYQVSMKQTEYGKGDSSKYYGWGTNESGNKELVETNEETAKIIVKYKSTSSGEYAKEYINQTNTKTITNPSSTYSSPTKYTGGAVKDANFSESVLFENNKTDVTVNITDTRIRYAEILGGALYNTADIDTINGVFVNNSVTVNVNEVTSERYNNVYAYGGAIYNGANTGKHSNTNTNTSVTIGNITADFIENYVSTTGTLASPNGGAIYNYGYGYGYGYGSSSIIDSALYGYGYGTATIGNITGDFIGNYVSSTSPDHSLNPSSGNLASGGAIYNCGYGYGYGYGSRSTSNAGTAVYGYGYGTATIGNITGDFIGNYASSAGDYISTGGGAIFNYGRGYGSASVVGNGSDAYGHGYGTATIGNITGNFIGNYASADIGIANGGAIYNSSSTGGSGAYSAPTGDANYDYTAYGTARLGDITGDFIGNYVFSSSTNANGGAISNKAYGKSTSTISTITGNFIGNYANGEYTYGGAIYNNAHGGMQGYATAQIGTIIGDFIGNYASSSTGYSGRGGAISNYGEASGTVRISSIVGDFIGNYADDNGGAIYNYGFSSDSIAAIGDITGNFIDNYAQSGGAIYNNNNVDDSTVTIGDIKGNFIGNYATDGSGGAICNTKIIGNITGSFIDNYASEGDGGAIYNYAGTIGNITGNFIGNYASAQSSSIQGGAIYNSKGIIGDITGSFIGNSASSNGNYDEAEGGAIYNYFSNTYSTTYISQIGNISGDFIGNYASASSDSAKGGAIYNCNENDDTTVQIGDISGNFIGNYASASSDSANGGAIYNYSENSNATVQIGDIAGNFIGNYASASSSSANGGAIYNYSEDSNTTAQIGDITGDFIENYASSSSSPANGGAIYNYSKYFNPIAQIGDISGNFIGNYASASSSSANGGAVYNYSSYNSTAIIDKLSGDFIDNYASGASASGGAIYNTGTISEIVNSSFIDNYAQATNGEAKGGAIYSTTDLNIIADNAQTVFEGNYTENTDASGNTTRDDNAIYLDAADAALNFNLKNNGSIVMADNIDGVDGYTVNITGDNKDNTTFYMFNDIRNSNLFAGNTTLNTVNNSVHVYDVNSFTLTDDTNFVADVDLANKEMDRFTAGSYGAHKGNLNVIGMNLLSDANMDEDVTAVYFAEPDLKNNVVNGTGELPDSYQTAYTPIYKYNFIYDTENEYDGKGNGGYFIFTRGDKIPVLPDPEPEPDPDEEPDEPDVPVIPTPPQGGGGSTGNPSDAFNPAVLATPVGNLAAGQAAMNETFKYVFEHADAFTQLPSMERYAKINANKYALSTDFNENLPSYADQLQNKAVWFRPYTTFETMNIKNGPKVDAITYGSLVGFDGDFKEMKNGWSRVFTGYAGYMGSSLNYSGVDTTMNGGLLGFTETFYKGNFWTAITASAGASVGESHTMYGKEDYTSLLAGVGSKTGYNFEFKDGKFIIQPIMFLSYTFVNTFDYKNAAGVNIESDPLHTIQLNPSVRFIANLKGGWQPYASVGMVWNLMNESKVTANNVKLPEMSVKPYVEYGVGVQRNWADKFTAFLQAMIRNGGRNGVALTGGFRFMLGSEPKNSDKPKVKKEIKSL